MPNSAPPTDIPAPLLSVLAIVSSFLQTLSEIFHRLPGSPILVRYIKSSYQDDPYRSVLEVLLVAFAARTLLKGRTRGEGEGRNWVKLSEKVGHRWLSWDVGRRVLLGNLPD
jgi:serine palmitoyltransferase